ncbi:MAG: ABC transporter permease [Prolixibacteraceae bacterium]|jgi:ABC-2 type transport system permease protein|nr:ABC transporter permease [Prolixibacteraceae bacterium]
MRTIFYAIQKEFIQIRRNKIMLRMIIMVPLLQMLVLVFAATFDMKNIDLFVVDHDLSGSSRELVSKFGGSPFFTVIGHSFDEQEASQNILNDRCDMVLTIPDDFEKKLMRDNRAGVQLFVNSIDGSAAQLAYSYAQAVIRSYHQNLVAETEGIPEFKPPYQVETVSRFWFNPELDYKWFMAPGILAILVTLIGLFLSGMSLVHEKEIGTIEQLNVTPIRKFHFLTGKLVPFLIIALFDLSFGLTIAHLVFNLPVVGSLWVLFGFSAVYLFGILGMGLLISTMAETQQQVMFVSFFIMLVFIMMGGIFTPVESMPGWAQVFNWFNPISYFMRVLRMVILKGSGFAELLNELLALLAFGVAFLVLAVRRYRKVS